MSTKMNAALISSWVWFFNKLIDDPQVVTDLYTDQVDDINNALQCNHCGSIFVPEAAICPDCNKRGHFEMVFAPGIEEDERGPEDEEDEEPATCRHGDDPDACQELECLIAHHDNETFEDFPTPVVTLGRGENTRRIIEVDQLDTMLLAIFLGGETDSYTFDGYDADVLKALKYELTEVRKWPQSVSDEELKKLANTVPMGMPFGMVNDEINKRGLNIVYLTPEQHDAIENGGALCIEHGEILWDGEMCTECHHQDLLEENPDLRDKEEVEVVS